MEKSWSNRLILFAVSMFAISLLALSCKKEEANPVEPIVKLISPYTQQQYSIYDTIFIELEVEHVKPVKRLSLSVTDDDEKPLLPVHSIAYNDIKFSVKSFIVIDNRYINESQNYLNIKIEDDHDVFNYWYEINILPLEKSLNGLLIITGDANKNRLSIYNMTGEPHKLLDWNSEYLGGYYDPRNQNFYTSGSLIDGIFAYNLKDSVMLWEVNTTPGNSLPHFTSFTASPGKVSAAIRGGYIESYNAEGIKIFKSTELTNGTFRKMVHYRNFIASVFVNYTSAINKLLIFNYPAGNTYDSINLEGDIIDIIPGENMEIYLIMDFEESINLWSYNFNQKSLLFRETIAEGESHLVTGNHQNMFLSNGNSVMWYKPDIGSNINYLELAGITAISFDSLNNALYVGKDDSLIQYILPSAIPQNSIRMESPIKDIEFIYNK